MNKNRAVFSLMLAAVLLLCSGCGGNSKAATADCFATAQTEAAPMMEEMMEVEVAVEDMDAGTTTMEKGGVFGEYQSTQSGSYGNHKIIATYTIEMNTDEFDTHLRMLQDKAIELGGYIQSSSVSGTKPETYNDYGRDARYSFRIPSDRAEEFVEYTKGTGEVTYSNCDTEDVTLTYYDTETRLQVLRTQLERLQGILVETDNLADIIELEKAISETTLEIEQYTTQIRRYDDLIDYTTVNVCLSENRLTTGPAAKKGLSQRISEGFSESLVALGVFLEDGLVTIVCAIPALVLIAVAVAVLVLLVRLIRKGTARGRARREAKAKERRQRMIDIEINIDPEMDSEEDEEK